MSEEVDSYIIYDSLEDALVKAEQEGSRRNYSYYRNGIGSRYKSYPIITSNNKYALRVNGYELTEDEQAAITTSVTFPTE